MLDFVEWMNGAGKFQRPPDGEGVDFGNVGGNAIPVLEAEVIDRRAWLVHRDQLQVFAGGAE